MTKDLRYALRMLQKSPAFTLMAIMALALGIGANTAIFSVVNSVMISKLPFLKPDRLAMVWEESPRSNQTNVVNPINFLEWKARNHSFDQIAALVPYTAALGGDGEPEQIESLVVTDGFFPILGVRPLLGRWFTPEEDTPGKNRAVILGEGLWRRRYGADPHILGRQILVNNRQVTVVGVMPATFRFPYSKAEMWGTLAIDRANSVHQGRYLSTIARLKEGATLASAQAEMTIIAGQLQKERPDFDSKWGITVVGLRTQVVGDVRTPLLVLLGAVGLVLLIACANVANLMLMRAVGRAREIAIRSALGASRLRVARQLLVESLLLAVLGGAAGLIVGLWSVDALARALPDTIAYSNLHTVRIDSTVFLFTLAVSIFTGILFGLAPAFRAARADVQMALKDGGRGVSGMRGYGGSALVVAEVALAMVLAIGAGLLIRSFARLSSVNPGFDARHVLTMEINTAGRLQKDAAFLGFLNEMLDRVRATPGVQAAGTSHYLPLGRTIPGTGFWRSDRPRPAHGDELVTEVLVVMPGYFAAMDIPLIRGRVLTDLDRAHAPAVVVINETLARKIYPNENPVGKRLNVEWDHPDEPYEIAGVVGDVHQSALGEAPNDAVFISNLQEPTTPVNLLVRASGDPLHLARAIESEIHSIDNNLPLSNVRTMDEDVSASVAAPRFNTVLLGAFASLALLLAAVGIFGVISYSVTARTQELGIRRALGADASSVLKLVLAQGMSLVGAGVILGAAGALAVTRLLQKLLFGVTPTDPMTFAGVILVIVLVALAACFVPARRALKVDPMEALRYE